MSSTYIKWILVAIALAVGVWVVARPSGRSKPDAAGASQSTDAKAPGEEAAIVDDGEAPPPVGQYRSTGTGTVPQAGQAPPASRVAAPSTAVAPRANASSQSPGSEAPSAVPVLGVWGDGYAQDVRERWREVQIRFVDDPQFAAGEAERVVDETVAALTASVNAKKEELNTWRSGRGDDTEQLRAAVNRYREFLDRLLGV